MQIDHILQEPFYALYMRVLSDKICITSIELEKKKVAMGEFKHFVIVKFKEGVVIEDLIKDMEKMVSQIDSVKHFEW